MKAPLALDLDLACLLALRGQIHLPLCTEVGSRLPHLDLDADPPGWRKDNRRNRLSGGMRMILNVKQGTRMDLLPR